MPRGTLIALLLPGLAVMACAGAPIQPAPPVVPHVDLDRYLGLWHEIARYPAWFQKGCHGSKADYRRSPGGQIRVLNTCRKGGPDGPLEAAWGRARVVDTTTNARLEVTFFWPFWGDYWIFALGERYDWVVVGSPTRRFVWVLARRVRLDDPTWQHIQTRLEQLGFEPDRLIQQ